MIFRKTAAVIDLSALISNLQRLQSLVGKHFFCPMVKANAYGHSAIEVTRVLKNHQVSSVGVATLEEAMELRNQFKDLQILMFGAFDKVGAQALFDYKITPVVNSFEQLQVLELQKNKITIHLKFNTGMNRMGLDLEDLDSTKKFLKSTKYLELEGLSTHFGVSPESEYYSLQINKFDHVTSELGLNAAHIYSSSKVTSNSPMTMGFRPGIALYGGLSQELSFRPVMTLKSELVRIRKIKPLDYVSYGAKFIAQRPSLIGVVSLGYADGFSRSLSHKGRVLINGHFAPVAGTVCMDYTMIDLTDVAASAQVGDEVVIIGTQGQNQILANDIADLLGTISYEILTSISARVPRVFIND